MIHTLPISLLYQFVDYTDFIAMIQVNKSFYKAGKDYLQKHHFKTAKEYLCYNKFIYHLPEYEYKLTPFICYLKCNDELICLETQQKMYILDYDFNLVHQFKDIIHIANNIPYLYQ